MKMETPSKVDLRAHFRHLRQKIDRRDRFLRSQRAFYALKPLLRRFSCVLSYRSFQEEFCTNKINTFFQKRGGLFFPESLDLNLARIDLIIAPGVAFDAFGNRLGFGKGYYDHLFTQVHCLRIGLGYTEQFYPSALPQDPWDISLDAVFLF